MNKRLTQSKADQRAAAFLFAATFLLTAAANFGCAMVFGLDELSVQDGAGGQGGQGGGSSDEQVLWSKTCGGAQEEILWDLAIGPEDRVALTGTTRGPASFGGQELADGQTGDEDIFVAVLDKDGEHVWSRRFGDEANQRPYGVAFDPQGRVVVAGGFNGLLDFGGGSLKADGVAQDVFIAKLDASNGAIIWANHYGDPSVQAAGRVVVSSDGEIVVMGVFTGKLDFGGNTAALEAVTQDIFVVKLTAAGAPIWAKQFGDIGVQQPWDLAIDAQGNLLLTGEFSGSLYFGGETLDGGSSSKLFIAKLDSSGEHKFSAAHGDEKSPQRGVSIAPTAAGGAVVAGGYEGSLPLPSNKLTAVGKLDAFTASFDASGTASWAKSFGDGQLQQVLAVATDPSGRILLAGMSEGSIDFGGGPLASAGGTDLFVALLSGDGGHLYSRVVGRLGKQEATAVGFSSSGELVIGGQFVEALDWLATPQPSAGNLDCFVVKLSAP